MSYQEKLREVYSISRFMIYLSGQLSDREFRKIRVLELDYFEQELEKVNHQMTHSTVSSTPNGE